MTVQNETAWLLGVIQTNWPEAEWPDDLVRRNRDESVTLDKPDSPLKEEGVDPNVYNVVGVQSGDKQRSLIGTKPQYRVVTTLDVRVEGVDTFDNGQIDGDDGFKTLVAYVQNAINGELVYPAVDTGDEDIGRVQYRDLGIIDETDLSPNNADYYRNDFTVRLRGYADTP